MRRLTLNCFVVLVALAAFAHADDWSKTYDLTGKPELAVEVHDAHVRIEAGQQNKIEAHVTTRGWPIGTGDLEIVDEQRGNAVHLSVKEPHRTGFSIGLDARRIELEIRMPRTGKVEVHSSDGNVMAKGLEGDFDFTTSDGKIELEDIDGNLRAHSSDGSMRVSGRFDGLELRTSDGHIELEARPGSQLRQAWEVRSSDGSVRLKIPGDLAADVELHTSDGSITTSIPIVVEGSVSHHNLRGKINGGGNRLTVYTVDGSVTLDKF